MVNQFVKAALVSLLALSGCVNMLLASKVSTLRAENSSLEEGKSLGVGAVVDQIQVSDFNNTAINITFSNQSLPTVLYLFSPQCIWCARNLNNIKALEVDLRNKYRFVGVSLSNKGVEEYVQKNDITFPVYRGIDPHARTLLGLGGTPQTVVISTNGRIISNIRGAYSKTRKVEIEKALQVSIRESIDP
jgi:Thioredoxin-like